MVVYLSFDVECDGRSPATHSMISIGVAAFMVDRNAEWRYDSFKVNLAPIPGRLPCPTTHAEFWSKHPAKYEACKVAALPPAEGMTQLFEWLDGLKQQNPRDKFKWVAGPACFDWQWLNYYYHMFVDTSKYKLHYKAECLSSVCSAYLDSWGVQGDERKEFKEKLAGRPNADPHDALEDAIHQGWQWVNLLGCMNDPCSEPALSLAGVLSQPDE
jgi:hypothetical protein